MKPLRPLPGLRGQCAGDWPGSGRVVSRHPRTHELDGVHEVTGIGTLFPDESGNPVHEKVWQVILHELTGSSGMRQRDDVTGFDLLVP